MCVCVFIRKSKRITIFTSNLNDLRQNHWTKFCSCMHISWLVEIISTIISMSYWHYSTTFPLLKIWAAWPDMLAVSVIWCKNEAMEKLPYKSIIKCFKDSENIIDQIYHVTHSPPPPPPIDCSVRRKNHEPYSLSSADIQSLYILIVTVLVNTF